MNSPPEILNDLRSVDSRHRTRQCPPARPPRHRRSSESTEHRIDGMTDRSTMAALKATSTASVVSSSQEIIGSIRELVIAPPSAQDL